MTSPLDILSAEAAAKLARAELPTRVKPMLAKLTHRVFSDPDWIFERKLDGERALAIVNGADVKLLSRNQKDIRPSYPELVEALPDGVDEPVVLDGEIVAFEGGVSSFAKLQPRMQTDDPATARASGVEVYYYLFDILHCDGRDTTALPLRARKKLLRAAVDFDDPLRFTPHRNEEGEAFYHEACSKGWEGLIAKDARSRYRGTRSSKWLKLKCFRQQELVIGGFTEPQGERIGFGALLVGFYEDGQFHYAGKVGTGYDEQTLRDLRDRMNRNERQTPPFDVGDPPGGDDVHYVSPKLVCEVAFTEWTEDDRLRHPSYRGLRRDKDPTDVVQER